MRHLLALCLLALVLSACGSSKPKHLEIGTGSRIDILTPQLQFYKSKIPAGWVIEGADYEDLFEARTKLPNIFMTQRNGQRGVHIQSGTDDFALVRYTRAKLLVSPYLSWQWHVSEHKNEHHPVRLLIGFYGGHPKSPPLEPEQFIWRGQNFPAFDRILSIGFDDMALKRGNLYSMGKVKYYVQRGGFEQTNLWHDEIVDLSLIYNRAWPTDDQGKVIITFVGMTSQSDQFAGGITFSSIRISR